MHLVYQIQDIRKIVNVEKVHDTRTYLSISKPIISTITFYNYFSDS